MGRHRGRKSSWRCFFWSCPGKNLAGLQVELGQGTVIFHDRNSPAVVAYLYVVHGIRDDELLQLFSRRHIQNNNRFVSAAAVKYFAVRREAERRDRRRVGFCFGQDLSA